MSHKGYQIDTNNVTPIKLTTISNDATYYFGYSGATSEENNSVEISDEVGRLLDLQDGDIVHVSIEYSFEKLKALELEPFTADDYEIIEKNADLIEEQLLNQIGVFYHMQRFVIFLGH
jgi:peroxin-1